MSDENMNKLQNLSSKFQGLGGVVGKYTAEFEKLSRELNRGIEVPKVLEGVKDIRHPTYELIETIKEQHNTEEEYFKSMLQTLQKIEQNTASLNEIVHLIQTNNEHQKQILEILQSILVELASAKSKEEADSIFSKIMDKINSLTKLNANINAVQSLYKQALTIYDMVKDYF